MAASADTGAAVAAMRRLISDHDLDDAGFLAVVAAVLRSSAQAQQRGGRITLAQWTPTDADWDGIAALYARTGFWSPQYGPDPETPVCRCPKEILVKHNIGRRALHE